MTDARPALAALRRPRLLIRAARFGLADYRRARDLKRLLGLWPLPAPQLVFMALIEAEQRQEDRRAAGAAEYSVTRHVELLIALMAEALAQEARAERGPDEPRVIGIRAA